MISKWAAKVGLAAVMLGAVTAAGAGTAPGKVMAYASTYVSPGERAGNYLVTAYAYYDVSRGSQAILAVAMYNSSWQKVLDINAYVGAPSWSGSSVVFNGTSMWNGSSVNVTVTFTPNTSNPLQGSLTITVHAQSGDVTFTRSSNIGIVYVSAS